MSAEGRVRVRALCNASWLHGHGCDDLEDNNTQLRSKTFPAQISSLVMCYVAVTPRIAEQRELLAEESHYLSNDSTLP